MVQSCAVKVSKSRFALSRVAYAATLASSFCVIALAGPLTLRDGYESVYAGWSGGDPIYSTHSWWASTNSIDSGSLGYQLLAHSRVTATTYTAFSNTLDSSMVAENNSYAYNGETVPGVPDTSTRSFVMGAEKWYVFTTTKPVLFANQISPTTHIGDWSYCFIEHGSYSGGVFTPSGSFIVDLLTFEPLSTMMWPAGAYRYQSKYDGVFEDNQSFVRTQSTTWSVFDVVPSPGALSLLGLGGTLASRRRR
ncbi:MAG: hypothetical protein KIT19_11415 [Phycisphaeraceae bacterium]|nr:hypothetical protein [Phycisphaeraceae bacterium]